MKTANSLRCNGISNGKLFGFFTVIITSKACDSPALLYNTLLQHISTGFFSKTSVQPVSTTLFCDIFPTLLYNTLLQHIPTMQQSSPTILSNALALIYITLFPNTYLQGSSPTLLYNIRLRHISTTLLYNTLLQHSSAGFFSKTSVQPVPTTLFCDISPTLLYNTLLQHIPTMQQFSPTILCNALALIYITLFPNTYLQGSSPTLLYNIRLRHISTTLLYNTLLQHSSAGFFSKTSVQPVSTTLFCDISPTLLYNTLLQHIPTMQQFSPTILCNALALIYITLFPNTYLQGSSPTLLYNIRLRHISTTLLYNTLLQHSSAGFFSKTSVQPVSTTLFCDISPMLLYNTLLQHIPTMQQSSPTVLCNALALIYITLFPNTYLQGSSPTLLYNLSLQHASPTLFLHETAFRCSNFVGNYYGSTNQV